MMRKILDSKYVKSIIENYYIKLFFSNKYVVAIFPSTLICIISTLFVFMLHFSGAFDNLELKLIDFRFNLRGPIYNDDNHANSQDLDVSEYKDVVIVEMDDESFRLIPESIPYGRGTIWSRVVKNLTDAGAKVIFIDAMFDKSDHKTKTVSDYFDRTIKERKVEMEFENSTSSQDSLLLEVFNSHEIEHGDSLFIESLNYAKSKGTTVVLSGKIAKEKNRLTLLKPESDTYNQETFGLVNVKDDSDGFIRKYPFFIPDPEGDSTLYYTAAVEVVLAYKNYQGDATINQFFDKFNYKEELASVGDSLEIKDPDSSIII